MPENPLYCVGCHNPRVEDYGIGVVIINARDCLCSDCQADAAEILCGMQSAASDDDASEYFAEFDCD